MHIRNAATLLWFMKRPVFDAQGYNLGGVPLLLVGAGKGVVGMLVRPGIGALELPSKMAYGLSLACLGKQGIVGTVQQRVRRPGAAAHDDEDAQLTASKLHSSNECVAFQCFPVRTCCS